MNLYKFCGRDRSSDYVAGFVKANSFSEAEQCLRNEYTDYPSWDDVDIQLADFSDDNVCEVYYG